MYRSHERQYVPPGCSHKTIGSGSHRPVCTSVSTSNPSSCVPKPPGKSTIACVHQEESDEHHFAGASASLRALALGLVPSAITVGIYVVVHGQLTPGGGFQGGVILAVGPLAVFLAGRYMSMKALAPTVLVEIGESLGAAGYALVGLGGLIFVGVFFKNFIPLGIPGHILSAGQMPLASIAVGLEVSGAFLVGWTQFFDQAMIIQGGEQ